MNTNGGSNDIERNENNNLMKNSHHEVLKSMTKFNNIFNLKFEKIFIKKI